MTTTERMPRRHPGGAGYPVAMREQAAAMRREGVSRASIARELRISFATIARWFREDGVPTPTHDGEGRRDFRVAHRRVIEERWALQQAEQDAHRDAVGPLTERELVLVGAALYWAEGAKSKPWRRAHVVSFMNSDPGVVRVFLTHLERLGIPRSSIYCQVSIHESADVRAAEARWRAVVGGDIAFHPPSLERHNPRAVRSNTGEDYCGCLAVRVWRGADTYRRIVGTWEGIAAAVGDGSRSPVV